MLTEKLKVSVRQNTHLSEHAKPDLASQITIHINTMLIRCHMHLGTSF